LPDYSHLEPLFLTGLADYHVHCNFSIDAEGSIDDYCQAGLRRGLAEMCFTTHYDSNPAGKGADSFIRVDGKNTPATVDNLAPYVDAVAAAHDKYFSQGLAVTLGLEFGWYAGCEEEVQKLQDRYPIEYMMAGIHELDDLCFCCHNRFEACFSRYSVEEAVEKYAGDVCRAAASGLFRTIAHLDYLRKYGCEFYGERLEQLLLERSGDMFAALKDSETTLEINTSAMRKGLDGYFPGMAMANRARRAGVDIRYLGSDAHRPEDVAFDFDAAAALVNSSIVACED